MAQIDQLLTKAQALGASDLHLSAEHHPRVRVDGRIQVLDSESVLRGDDIFAMVREIMPEYARQDFESFHDADFAYTSSNPSFRFRVNVFVDRKGPGLVARALSNTIPSLADLGVPAALLDFCHLNKGLFIVTGPTGSGKSTTLAAMVDCINRHRSDHIVTIEDPIEYVHESKRCLVNQREVPRQAHSFARALRAALREDPDVVLVGEMRDLETIEMALETAETGHLVLGTLHTTTAYSATDRIINVFPPERQTQIRTMLAGTLRGVLAQTLCKKQDAGRVAATELLVVTDAVANMIREGNVHQIPSVMQTGRDKGMHLMEDSLAQLVSAGTVVTEEALHHANDKDLFKKYLLSKDVVLPETNKFLDHSSRKMDFFSDDNWLEDE